MLAMCKQLLNPFFVSFRMEINLPKIAHNY